MKILQNIKMEMSIKTLHGINTGSVTAKKYHIMNCLKIVYNENYLLDKLQQYCILLGHNVVHDKIDDTKDKIDNYWDSLSINEIYEFVVSNKMHMY
jgi:hypothetical protein